MHFPRERYPIRDPSAEILAFQSGIITALLFYQPHFYIQNIPHTLL